MTQPTTTTSATAPVANVFLELPITANNHGPENSGSSNSSNSSNSSSGKNARPPPPKPQRQTHRYGADNLSARQFWLIQIALVLGSSIEWYDFATYGALASVFTPVFFPPSASAATQALYFWGVFALSFVTRPIGAILLGSVGDRWGRRPALLASLAGMAIPTVLIGCLPTYAQAGIAAPILLALLRAIQGLAMGCEFSGAMIYSVELAPKGRSGVFGGLSLQGGILGTALGNAVVMVLTAALTAAQLSAWGWRLPFLITVFSGLGAFVLRMHMPEPRAWEECAHDGTGNGNGNGGVPAPAAADGGEKTAAADDDNTTTPPTTTPTPTPQRRQPRRRTPGSPVLRLLRRSWAQVILQSVYEAFPSVAFYLFAMWLPSELQRLGVMDALMAPGVTIAALALMGATLMLGGHASDACATPRRRMAASCVAVVVGTGVAVPGFLGVAQAGAAAKAAAGAAAAAAAALRSAQTCAALFQLGMLALVGFALGMVPSLCADLYKPNVRVVSFSLAHNLSMSLLGGTAPLVVAAMAESAAGKAGAAPGVYIAAAGLGTLLAAAVLGIWAPRLFVAAEGAGTGAADGAKEESAVAAAGDDDDDGPIADAV